MANNDTVVAFLRKNVDLYDIEDIYDPDKHGLDPELSGKIIPRVKSLVIDDIPTLWSVDHVDDVTHRTTLVPLKIIQSADDDVKILSYGNDRFCLYYDDRTDPHGLIVDAKLLIYGNNIVEYRLVRVNKAGDEEIISMYLDSNDVFKSDRVPMADVGGYRGFKIPTNCHTTETLSDGEPIQLRVYNNRGTLSAEITLYARRGNWNNDLASHRNPIVSLDATAQQMKNDYFYLYEKQDPKHLNIQPYVTYADGSRQYLNVDNVSCFIYGLEDLVNTYPGYSQTIVIKYFLNHKETVAQGSLLTSGRRMLTISKKIVVLQNKNDYGVKLSVLPIWDPSNESYTLRFFAYNNRRQTVDDVTNLVTYRESSRFVGTFEKFGNTQKVTVDFDLQSVFNTSDPLPGSQTFWITTWNRNSAYVGYTLRDSESDDYVYGAESSLIRKPIIHYDKDLKRYYIPTSVFENKDAVIQAFYTVARPPFDRNVEISPVTPTHFTIRSVSNASMLISEPIPIAEYGQLWGVIQSGSTDQLVGGSVVVEFLTNLEGTMAILYGVPVDVVVSKTGYNTEKNPIY